MARLASCQTVVSTEWSDTSVLAYDGGLVGGRKPFHPDKSQRVEEWRREIVACGGVWEVKEPRVPFGYASEVSRTPDAETMRGRGPATNRGKIAALRYARQQRNKMREVWKEEVWKRVMKAFGENDGDDKESEAGLDEESGGGEGEEESLEEEPDDEGYEGEDSEEKEE